MTSSSERAFLPWKRPYEAMTALRHLPARVSLSRLYHALYIILRLPGMSTDFDTFTQSVTHFTENALFSSLFHAVRACQKPHPLSPSPFRGGGTMIEAYATSYEKSPLKGGI